MSTAQSKPIADNQKKKATFYETSMQAPEPQKQYAELNMAVLQSRVVRGETSVSLSASSLSRRYSKGEEEEFLDINLSTRTETVQGGSLLPSSVLSARETPLSVSFQ